MLNDKVIRTAFLISLFAHCLFLGMPGFNLDTSQPEKPKELSVQIEIEKPLLLPKIDVMGEEKKLKEIAKDEKLPEPEPEPEPEPPLEEEKVTQEPELEEQIEEVLTEESKIEPPKEIIEVINPQEEAMFRYQDMVKQKIESCRRYPNWAKKQGFEGIVYLTFMVLSNGQVRDVRIVNSSEFVILDKEAISTIKRASPFLPIPKKFNCSYLKMEVSIVFSLQ